MSLEISVYTGKLNDDLIPVIQSRLNEFEMACEIYPRFSFSDHSGFLPFKFKLSSPPFEKLRGLTLLSGFEVYIDNFDFEEERRRIQKEPGMMGKLMGNKVESKPLVSEAIDSRLMGCNRIVSFVWHAADSFELRFASLTSALLSVLTNGVCAYPADNLWYGNEGLVEKAWLDVRNYESQLTDVELVYHEFEKWD